MTPRTPARAIQHPGDIRWETRLLLVVTATLTVFGIVSLFGAASFQTGALGFALRQGTGALAGGVLLLIAARTDYRVWRRVAWPLLFATLLALLIPVLPFTTAIAPVTNGARRWISLGPVTFQPSEVAKFVIVVWAAMLAAKKGTGVRQFRRGVAPFLLVIGSVSLLILLQPNLSMATVVAMLGGLVLFTAGAKIGHFLLLGAGGVLLVFQQIAEAQYRLARLTSFLNQGAGIEGDLTQVQQSLIGVGSGGALGTGFGQGQLKLGHLPYAYSDFIFSTIGEEWGFLGVVLVLGLYGLFCWMGFRIARTIEDPFGQFLATGLTAAIGVTALLHVAVTLGMMPATGLTLPFMSYGRSSLMMSLMTTGVLISVGRARGRPPQPNR